MSKQLQQGFSLIELSIVLVIMGLLIAGVSAGSSLVKSAELRALMTQVENFKVASGSYYAKKGRLPGDDASTTDANFAGNANGLIEFTTNVKSQFAMEGVNVWKHFVDQEILSGTYAGHASTAAAEDSVDVSGQVATAKKKGGVWVFDDVTETINGGTVRRNYIFLINKVALATVKNDAVLKLSSYGANGLDKKGVMPAIDVASLDEKYDDADPKNGGIRSYASKPSTADDDTNYCDYAASDSNTAKCAMAFKLGL